MFIQDCVWGKDWGTQNTAFVPTHSHGSQFASRILIKSLPPQVVVLTCTYRLQRASLQRSLGARELGLGEEPWEGLWAASVRADEVRLQ